MWWRVVRYVLGEWSAVGWSGVRWSECGGVEWWGVMGVPEGGLEVVLGRPWAVLGRSRASPEHLLGWAL